MPELEWSVHTYIGSFKEKHSKRRQLMGSELNHAVTSMLDFKMSSSVYRKDEANRLMVEGDSIPAQIPTLNSLHKAKSKAIAAQRLHAHPVLALCTMKQNEGWFCNSVILASTNFLYIFGVISNLKFIQKCSL